MSTSYHSLVPDESVITVEEHDAESFANAIDNSRISPPPELLTGDSGSN